MRSKSFDVKNASQEQLQIIKICGNKLTATKKENYVLVNI